MKTYNLFKFILLIGAVFYGTADSCPQEINDTVKIIDKAREVIVTKSGSKTKIVADLSDSLQIENYYIYELEVLPSDSASDRELAEPWEVRIPFMQPRDPDNHKVKRKKIKREVLGFTHLYWGWRFNYNDRQQVENSFEVGVRELIGVAWSRGKGTPSFSVGAGFGMMRLNARDGFAYCKSGDAVSFYPVADGVKVDKTKLDIWRFHVPVLMELPLGKHGHFCLGGIINLNTYATAMTQTISDDKREKIKYKGLQQNLLTADIFASVSVFGIGLYATWSPVSAFKNGYGPELKAWSLGMDLLTF